MKNEETLNFNNFIVILPTYNEKDNISELIDKIYSLNLSILIVDDNSPDGTYTIVQNKQKKYKNLYLIKREKKLGLGSAYREGYSWSINMGFKSFIQMDADNSHTISDLKNLINNSLNTDIVIGSRYIQGGMTVGWNSFRKILSISANYVANKLLNLNIYDSTSGFRIYSLRALKTINYASTRSEGYGFQIEMTHIAKSEKLNIKEIPITFVERNTGKSKINKKIITEALFLLIKLRLGNVVSKN